MHTRTDTCTHTHIHTTHSHPSQERSVFVQLALGSTLGPMVLLAAFILWLVWYRAY